MGIHVNKVSGTWVFSNQLTGATVLSVAPGGAIQLGDVAIAALRLGGGTATTKLTTAAADKNFIEFRLESTATLGCTRGIYQRLYLNGAGQEGEAARFYTDVQKAVSGGVHGAHVTLGVNTGGSIGGLGVGVRATLEVASGVTPGGTLASLQVDSFVASGVSLPATHSFIRASDEGAVRFTNLLAIPNVSNGTIFAAHTTQVLTHSIKFISADGTVYYIMCTNAATNRS